MSEAQLASMALSITGVSVGYGKRTILSYVNLAIEPGEWCTLLGPNGAGKSTLLHAIVGTLDLRSGAVAIGGHSVATRRVDALRRLGFACAPERLPTLLTGRQCLQVYAAAHECEVIDASVLELAATLKFVDYLDQYVDTYSLGTRQKLCVLLALLGSPSLLVLDEAFNGLDPASALALKRYLRGRVSDSSLSVLLATHSIDIVEHYSDSAALLWNGSIARRWDRQALSEMRTRDIDFESELARAVGGE